MESRRTFLKTLVAGAAAVVAARWGIDSAEAGLFGWGGPGDEWLSLGKLEDLPDGGRKAFHEAANPETGKRYKSLKLIAERQGDKVYVLSTRCTHFGCEVTPQEDGTYLCPCHGAQFKATGEVAKGPAKKPLPWYEVRVNEGDVQVNLSKTVPAPARS